MQFNTLDFTVFLIITFLCYWFVFAKNYKIQNSFIVFASLIFYGWWDWHFVPLLLLSAAIDFFVGLRIFSVSHSRKRKFLLLISIVANLSLLGFFKYYNFFVESFTAAFLFFGQPIDAKILNIVLPIGISFYTFQALSYTVDIYRNKLTPTRDFISFMAFICFFPQLVAGPIERATQLLPQFLKTRSFNSDQARTGMRQILWGLVKKAIVADHCGKYVDMVFQTYSSYSGSTLMIAAMLFGIQIYCDFSGYSDIAIGTARLFGIDLMQNFNFPYFSKSPGEFWRRWHISLTQWFRDYVYFPLGGNRNGYLVTVRNILIVFILSGLWHGANWTFITWGFINAIYLAIDYSIDLKFPNSLSSYRFVIIKRIGFIFLISFSWIFFRSQSVTQAIDFIKHVFNNSFFSRPDSQAFFPLLLVSIFLLIEWNGRESALPLENIKNASLPVRWSMYFIIITLIAVFSLKKYQFIYFQF